MTPPRRRSTGRCRTAGLPAVRVLLMSLCLPPLTRGVMMGALAGAAGRLRGIHEHLEDRVPAPAGGERHPLELGPGERREHLPERVPEDRRAAAADLDQLEQDAQAVR